MARHAQITQNKFAISLQYLKKELSNESLLEINSMILMGMVKYSQSSQNSEFAMSLRYLKKLKIKLISLHADKHQSFVSLFQHFGHQRFL